jgi:uncharacterized protein YhbP (UPF0306 family)
VSPYRSAGKRAARASRAAEQRRADVMNESAADVPAHVLDYLATQRMLSLATASRDGRPHASTLLYASEGSDIYIWTRPETTTAKHLAENPEVSFTITDQSGDWRNASGLQASGRCETVQGGGDIAKLVGLFSEKFDDPVAEESTAGIVFFRISPTELRYIGGAAPGTQGRQDPVGAEFRQEDL